MLGFEAYFLQHWQKTNIEIPCSTFFFSQFQVFFTRHSTSSAGLAHDNFRQEKSFFCLRTFFSQLLYPSFFASEERLAAFVPPFQSCLVIFAYSQQSNHLQMMCYGLIRNKESDQLVFSNSCTWRSIFLKFRALITELLTDFILLSKFEHFSIFGGLLQF